MFENNSKINGIMKCFSQKAGKSPGKSVGFWGCFWFLPHIRIILLLQWIFHFGNILCQQLFIIFLIGACICLLEYQLQVFRIWWNIKLTKKVSFFIFLLIFRIEDILCLLVVFFCFPGFDNCFFCLFYCVDSQSV